MRKNIFLFNLILSMLISLNYNMAYSEPKENTKQNEEIESQPYKTLEELKKELKEERRQIDQQRLEEIRKREQEKREELGEPENTDKNDNEKKKSEEKKNKENEYIPSLIVRLRGKHSTKYLCSYHFVIENDNTESELDKTNFDDYNQLLKKPSLKVRAGEVVNFEFSEKPIKVRAYIWDDEIKELKMNRGTIKVPQLDKKIVVGVEGTYKNGKILYAVVLDVRG
ncbi:hypothetical protein [uncultured Clostridium sp.]|uniref:hypothetical protein n=1 Tax=Clostridium sp. TaxID=1506 RepID=UPI0025DA0B80|nr:hypothetical protein [uncultured Clostridium sp.]